MLIKGTVATKVINTDKEVYGLGTGTHERTKSKNSHELDCIFVRSSTGMIGRG